MENQLRLIKKYPNRRLYDTKTSSYITLADVKQMVLKQEEFQVVDAKSGDDLTRQILLQIILEEESGGAPMFSSDLLSQMIRSYGNAMQGMMGGYLERNVRAFQDIQKALQEQSQRMYGDNSRVSQDLWAQFMNLQGPAMQSLMQAYIEQSQKMFAQFQEQMQSQARNMFTGLSFPGFPSGQQKSDNDKSQGWVRFARLSQGAGRFGTYPHAAARRRLRHLAELRRRRPCDREHLRLHRRSGGGIARRHWRGTRRERQGGRDRLSGCQATTDQRCTSGGARHHRPARHRRGDAGGACAFTEAA